MKRISLVFVAAGLSLLAGCATPPAVKQAVSSLNEGYEENMEMMRQYRQLVLNINQRHKLWTLHVQRRAKLDLALQWATTDPKPVRVGDRPTDQEYAMQTLRILGPEVIAIVNQMRLEGLPARNGVDSEQAIFKAGTNNMTTLVQAIPGLVNAISQNVGKEYDRLVSVDLTGFDVYQTNVAALRQINRVIQRYLETDVTVQREDVQEISESIRELAN